MTRSRSLYGLVGTQLTAFATFFALCLSFTLVGCMESSNESPDTQNSVTDPSPGGETNSIEQALGIGCETSSQCTIAAISATDAPIASCMVADGTCQTLTDPVSEDNYQGCVALVDLACVGNLASNGAENCSDNIDNDSDGDVDCLDLDCVGVACVDGNACTVGDYCSNGGCVGGSVTPDLGPPPANECFERVCDPEVGWRSEPLPAETSCGTFDSECNVSSFCDGEGVCAANTSTSTCCDNAYDCPTDLCADWGDNWYRSCSEDILESSFGQCSCVNIGTEICYDGLDNDSDGLTDCSDSECSETARFCTATTSCCETSEGPGCSDPAAAREICRILEDNYCCDVAWDYVCVQKYDEVNLNACNIPETEVACNDEVDNDFDGFSDCEDSNCTGTTACPVPVEICTDDIDNDGDELTDCLDSDCTTDPSCTVVPATETWWCWSAVTACDPFVEPQVWSIQLPLSTVSIPAASVNAPFCTNGGAATTELPDSGQCCRDGGGWPNGVRTCNGTALNWSLLP